MVLVIREEESALPGAALGGRGAAPLLCPQGATSVALRPGGRIRATRGGLGHCRPCGHPGLRLEWLG